jgi:hypothetical protein
MYDGAGNKKQHARRGRHNSAPLASAGGESRGSESGCSPRSTASTRAHAAQLAQSGGGSARAPWRQPVAEKPGKQAGSAEPGRKSTARSPQCSTCRPCGPAAVRALVCARARA